jgi:hypothetical protein
MRRVALVLLLLCLSPFAHATIFSQLHGIVHDPQHRPVAGARVELHAAHSSYTQTTTTAQDGAFVFAHVPLGDFFVRVVEPGFDTLDQTLTIASDTAPILHLQLAVGQVRETVNATAELPVNPNTVTPTTLVDRSAIEQTPGADRTDSAAMITDFVPGAYITHDMLHMRGGHQVSWQIDGVEIPNTNIASNLGPQIDPKDIDYLETQRGSYNASLGDRTYGIFNVVPRSGFERDRQGELVLAAGNFLQSNAQISFGDHTEKFAWYTSLNGNRSDYGLSTPVPQVMHDAANGFGGFASFLYNRTPQDQLRLVTQVRTDFFQIPYDPSTTDFEASYFQSSGLRDAQRETDGFAAFTWLHTFKASTVLSVSPFFHSNLADYHSNPNDLPNATTADRTSTYAGAQAALTTEFKRNTIETGLYSFGQHDSEFFGAVFNNGEASNLGITQSPSGGVVEEYVSDNWKATDWLTLIAGVRVTQFQGAFTEHNVAPRLGAALRVPRLHWVFRAFYGHFYQPPPLLTASGPLLDYANANNTGFAPLHGERDEEHQFGVQIPLPGPFSGWLIDADTFKTRANNFLDHSNIGDSSIYFPITVDGALIRAWELTLRSPRLWRFGQAHLAYSNQIAEQRGAITGGLICEPVSSPDCIAQGSFEYIPLDHDQRNTLNVGFNANLPHGFHAATNVYYGSGFTNGDPVPAYPNGYLPQHTTFDLSASKAVGENTTVSITALNVANYRVLLDNSITFGGFHWNDPRQLYGEVRYRFHF